MATLGEGVSVGVDEDYVGVAVRMLIGEGSEPVPAAVGDGGGDVSKYDKFAKSGIRRIYG